ARPSAGKNMKSAAPYSPRPSSASRLIGYVTGSSTTDATPPMMPPTHAPMPAGTRTHAGRPNSGGGQRSSSASITLETAHAPSTSGSSRQQEERRMRGSYCAVLPPQRGRLLLLAAAVVAAAIEPRGVL